MDSNTDFLAPGWLRNCHAQTVFPSTPLCRAPQPQFRRERIELLDGDFVEADWIGDVSDPGVPLLVLLHGLEGSSESTYARMQMQAAFDAGWAGVVLHFRGCGGSSNRLPRRYHAGDTGDVSQFVENLRDRFPRRTLLGIGYSLGGNILLKYLGESGDDAPFDCAIGVSVPYDLKDSARALAVGTSRIYQRFMLSKMRQALQLKYIRESSPFDWDRAMRARTFYEFDDVVTAPLHGFRGADEYYARSSSSQYLKGIRKPTLLIGALDDPFMTPDTYPTLQELSATTKTAFTPNGGHVGFVYGRGGPWNARYWLPERTMRYFVDELGIATATNRSTVLTA